MAFLTFFRIPNTLLMVVLSRVRVWPRMDTVMAPVAEFLVTARFVLWLLPAVTPVAMVLIIPMTPLAVVTAVAGSWIAGTAPILMVADPSAFPTTERGMLVVVVLALARARADRATIRNFMAAVGGGCLGRSVPVN